MKAATSQGFGKNTKLMVHNTDKPALSDNDVLVEVYASSVNPKDWKLNTNISGFISALTFLPKPYIIGDDLAGVVTKVGAKVINFKAGDPIYGMDMQLRTAACAEFAIIDQTCIAHKPANLTYSEAASAPLAALTALQGLILGQVKPSSKVLIIGASGGVGVFAVQIAKAMGAQVTAVCSGKNTDLVKQLGADNIIDYQLQDFTQGDNDFAMVFDVTSYESLSSCRTLMTDTGIFVSTGGNGKALRQSTWAKITSTSQQAQNVWVKPNTADLETLTAYFEQGVVKPVIDSEFTLDNINQAYTRNKTGRCVGKVVVKIKPDQ